jgi:hypothetical protein
MSRENRPYITQPEHEILCALNELYFLSAPQVQRLYYSPKILHHVQTLLKGLYDETSAKNTFSK